MRRAIIYIDDVDSYEMNSLFQSSSVEERLSSDRKKRLMMRKIHIISNEFLLTRERQILEIYVYHNHNFRDLLSFVHSDNKYYAVRKVKKILGLLRQFVIFFTEHNYKEIDKIVQHILLPQQYEFLKVYLRLHSYRRCGLFYGITFQAIRDRLVKIIARLHKDIRTKPLVHLIFSLQRTTLR